MVAGVGGGALDVALSGGAGVDQPNFWPIYQAGIAFRQAHVATYGSASTLLREVVFVVLGFGVANVLAAIIIFGVMRWLYGRQIKKRSHYDEAVTVAAYERAALPL